VTYNGQCAECGVPVPQDGDLCDACAEVMKERMARAFGVGMPERREPVSTGDPIYDWAQNGNVSDEARMEEEINTAYWRAGLGCALNDGFVREGEPCPIKEDYCVFDVICPEYAAGDRDMLDNPHRLENLPGLEGLEGLL
jgi:hypothetical protein